MPTYTSSSDGIDVRFESPFVGRASRVKVHYKGGIENSETVPAAIAGVLCIAPVVHVRGVRVKGEIVTAQYLF